MPRDSMPTPEEFNQFRVTNPGQSEVIRQRLYDYLLYPTAGQTQLSFFQTAIGQGVTTAAGGTVGQPKTYWDTNMQLAGQLPSGTSYMVESLEILFLPGSVNTANTYTPANLSLAAAANAATVAGPINDVNTILQSGLVEFNVLQKNYLRETPLLAFPPKAMLDLSAALASTSATQSEVAAVLAKAAGRPYYVEPEIVLQPAMNFEVIVKWPAAVATPSGFNARIGAIFDGYLMRASQ